MPPANPALNLDQSREVISEKPSSQPGFQGMDRSSSRADPQRGWNWYAQADQGGVGVGFAEGLDPATNFRKQVTRFELEVIAVDEGHRGVARWRDCPMRSSILKAVLPRR